MSVMDKAIKIAVDGTVELIDVEMGYPGLNKNFGGGLIEVVRSVPLADEFDTAIMIVDEEGRVNGLPRNESATRLYVPKAYRRSHFIAGDALIICEQMTEDGPDFAGVTTNVTVEAVTALIARFADN